MKRNVIVMGTLLLLMIISVCLRLVWSGFMYFSLAFLTMLCLYWFLNLIIYYLQDYHYNFDEGFAEYKAIYINTSNMTTEEFEESEGYFLKKYKRSLIKYKLIDIGKMLILLMIIIVASFATIK